LRNPGFERALALLAHPVCLAALGLLLLNDHVFRRAWPSWWTGKLGDAAWLLFAPFALAAGLAWLPPLRRAGRERLVFPLAFGLTGVCFGALKLLPGLLGVAMRSASTVLRTPLSLRADPTDLLALPALGLGLFLWRTTPAAPLRRPAGLALLPVAALLTLANAAMPDPGILCLASQDGQIIAAAGYAAFASQDGGRSWSASQLGGPDACQRDAAAGDAWQEVDGPQPGVRYRYRPGQAIQIAIGAGQDWQTVYDLGAASEAREMYYLKSRPGNPVFEPGPLDALPDPASGNMLFAMGHQGVLVHTAEGRWTWSAVAGYHAVEPFPTADAFSLLLGGMLYPAAGLALLIFASLALRWTVNPLRLGLAVVAWAAWLLVVALFPPATSYGYTLTITGLGILGLFVVLVPLVVEQTLRLARRQPRALAPLAAFGLLGGLLFLLPYLLWLYSTLPGILWATLFALALAVAVLVAAFFSLRRLPAWRAPERNQAGP
jgi:hypothetical protein